MKKYFEIPEIEVQSFCVEDVITASAAGGDNTSQWGSGGVED